MKWFGKKKDVVDLTYLAKRGIVKVPEQNEGYKDLTPSASSADSGLGFLAGIAASSESPKSSFADSGIKNKIEDFEYKLDAMSKRISSILDRLDLVEKKLDRDLRSGSLD